MKLVIINGSIHRKGNTQRCLQAFQYGYQSNGGECTSFYIDDIKTKDTIEEILEENSIIMIGFPITLNFIPSDVLEFIQMINQSSKDLSLLYLVNSGFPEASHSRNTENYLRYLTIESGNDYYGTLIRGGFKGFELLFPPTLSKNIRDNFIKKIQKCGSYFAKHHKIRSKDLLRLSSPEKLPIWIVFILKIIGINHSYFDKNFVKSSALLSLNDQPFIKGD